MWKLFGRLVAFVVLLAIVVSVGSWTWRELWRLRHPQRAGAMQLLEDRLGSMTPEQRRLANTAVKRDWMMAVLAAEDGGWERVKHFATKKPDDILQIQGLALNAGLQGAITPATASRFTDAAFTQLVIMEQVDPAAATSLRDNLKSFSPEEYKNIGFDGSYLLIAPKLDAKHRATFRQYQDVLTPLLETADPEEWNSLLERFEKALPNVAEIARDPTLGTLYAWVYMLHTDLAEALIKSLPTSEGKQRERDVLDFIGLNASVLAKSEQSPSVIADQVHRIQTAIGPDKHSLFEWACSDGAVYWLLVEMQRAVPTADREEAFQNAVTILGRYAGTAVPAILTSYADNPDSFSAAIEALLRFDNFDAEDENQQQVAAKFLCHYQNDPIFKAELAKHGPKLIPALSVGGEDALAEISRNPNDIGRYVTPDATPITGKPWWTWVPGGNVAYLGRELLQGRTTEWADWAWAGTDMLIVVPVTATGRSILVRIAAESGRKTTGRVIAKQSVEVGSEIAAKAGGRVTLQESLIVLRNAGIKVSKGSLQATKWIANNPRKALMLTGGFGAGTGLIICTLYPEKSAEVLDNASVWIRERIEHASREAGRTLAGMPGEFLGGIMDEVNELAGGHPLLAPLFYLLAFMLIAGVLLVPLVALKFLLPQAYGFLLYCVALPFRFAGGIVSWSKKNIVHTARPAS